LKILQGIAFSIFILVFGQLISMERPPQPANKVTSQASFDSLPGDVKRLLIPLIASGNVAEVANTILALNRTSRSVRAYINTPAGLIGILERMPYTFKAIDLVELLQKTNLPVARDPAITAWVAAARGRLVNGLSLFAAAEHNNIPRLRELLRNPNIDMNSAPEDRRKYTALMSASFLGFSEIVRMLVAAGADLNLQDDEGWTALMMASDAGSTNIVDLLLAAGADTQERNNDGERARDIAVRRNRQNIVDQLDAHAFVSAVLQAEPEEVAPLLPPSSKKPRTE
jgi:hypothetical protein